MKKWILTSIIATIFIQGCVVIPKQDNVIKENIETSSERCEKVGIRATFTKNVYSDFTAEVPIDVNERWRGSRNPSLYVIDEMKKSGFIDYPPSETNFQKYFIIFKIVSRHYKNLFQRTTLWVSDLTLGILPGWGDGEYYLFAELQDSDGNKVTEYTSTIVNFDYYHGLLLLPINYYEHTGAYVSEKYLPQLTREIIGKMIKDKLIKCK